MTERTRQRPNDKYVRKDVHTVEHQALQKECQDRHANIALQLSDLKKKQEAIDRKITATLVFGLMTLASIIVAIVARALV